MFEGVNKRLSLINWLAAGLAVVGLYLLVTKNYQAGFLLCMIASNLLLVFGRSHRKAAELPPIQN